MKEKLLKIISTIFSLFLIVALLGGGIIFILFIIALIIGGTSGEALATAASSKIMPIFIRSASIAVLAGLISFYLTGNHSLSLDEDNSNESYDVALDEEIN